MLKANKVKPEDKEETTQEIFNLGNASLLFDDKKNKNQPPAKIKSSWGNKTNKQ